MTQHPRIAIIGGGPSGLTLARILHINGIAATVFEREDHAYSRPQGGTLDLHEDTGQLALQRANLSAEFKGIARYDDQGGRIYNKAGELLLADDDTSGNRPEVDRSALREILLASLPDNTVQWGHDLREVRINADGTYALIFATQTVEPFDLIVGADGAWSRIRPLVSHYKPQYSGLTFIEFGIDDIDASHPDLAKLVGGGKIDVEGDGKGLIVQRNANSHCRGYAIFRVPADWADKTFDFSSPARARARLADEYTGWAPELVNLILASNDHIVPRLIYALPVGHQWPNRSGITLMGDAAHVTSPFGGEGVNAAMRDAAELGAQLVGANDWREAVKLYEQEMFIRVAEPALDSADAAATQLSHLGAELSLEHMRQHAAMR